MCVYAHVCRQINMAMTILYLTIKAFPLRNGLCLQQWPSFDNPQYDSLQASLTVPSKAPAGPHHTRCVAKFPDKKRLTFFSGKGTSSGAYAHRQLLRHFPMRCRATPRPKRYACSYNHINTYKFTSIYI